MKAQYVVAILFFGAVALAAYDMHKNRDNFVVAFLPAPTFGSVKFPPLYASGA